MQTQPRKVLLVQPPFYRLFHNSFSLNRYPLSLGYLAGAVRQSTDWQVAVYNADFKPGGKQPGRMCYLTGRGFECYRKNLRGTSGPVWDEIQEKLARYRPDAVGFTATSQTFLAARRIAALAKQMNPRITVLFGGPHASMAGAQLLECPEIDVAVRGEGEQTLVELLRAIGSGNDPGEIPGTIFRRDGRIVESPPRLQLQDLDSLCMPNEIAAEVLLDYERYPRTAFRNLLATRGCPYGCLFCGSRQVWGRTVRFRSPASVVREIQGLQRMGQQRVHFEDDTFGTNREHIHRLCHAIRQGCPGIPWSCELHVNLVNRETIREMKAAGCDSIAIGVESGSNEILAQMRKGITVERALEACRVIRELGVDLTTFFMVGLPQETEETLASTVQTMRATRADELVYSIFTPYPQSEAWDLCRRQGLVGDDFDASLYHHQSPANCFCAGIAPARFRVLARRVERLVDHYNARRKRLRKLRRFGRKWAGKLGLAGPPPAPAVPVEAPARAATR